MNRICQSDPGEAGLGRPSGGPCWPAGIAQRSATEGSRDAGRYVPADGRSSCRQTGSTPGPRWKGTAAYKMTTNRSAPIARGHVIQLAEQRYPAGPGTVTGKEAVSLLAQTPGNQGVRSDSAARSTAPAKAVVM